MQIGPVQIVVIGFPESESLDELAAELDALRSAPGIRLLDLLSVRKDDDGRIEILEVQAISNPDRGDDVEFVSALTGLAGGEPGNEAPPDDGSELTSDDVWYIDEAIPAGRSATIALIEHTWAIGLRDHIRDAGGALLADAWVHPSDLVAAGLVTAEQAERELLF